MEGINKNIVCDFYKALAARDTEMVHHLLAPDIDWWFHGPPAHKYNLMQLLTGGCVINETDSYEPLVVVSIGSIVVAEGYHIHENRKTYWVHVWTVENGKNITEVREYLDTSVTVTQITKCKNMWESKLADNDSVPSLLLVV